MSARRHRGGIRIPKSSTQDIEADREAANLKRAAANNRAVPGSVAARGALPNSALQRLARLRSGEHDEPVVAVSRAHLQRGWMDDLGKVVSSDAGKATAKAIQTGGMLGNIQAQLMEALEAMHLVKKGAVGMEVFVLQIQMNELGASPKLAVDGIFGPKTRRAVVMFQKANHLAPDGIVGAQTRAAIKAQLTVQASIAAIQAAFGSMREFEKRIEALAG